MESIDIHDVELNGGFWEHYIDLLGEKFLLHQWDILADRADGTAKSGCIRNFLIKAGRAQGSHSRPVFIDSDLAKWLEAVGNYLALRRNDKLASLADEAIALVEAAQDPDGYLDTYFSLNGIRHFSNLRDGHELYVMGHFIEAGVAYHRGTGKRRLLDVAIRMADLVVSVFSAGGECERGLPGHEEIEFALIRLFESTGNRKYLEMAGEFLKRRGAEDNWFDEEKKAPDYREIYPDIGSWGRKYSQNHKSVYDQDEAVGHAVRATYLYTAMAEYARLAGDLRMLEAAKRLWKDIVSGKMYITGAIGSTAVGESFSASYDLPNDSGYCETCASIGLIRFSAMLARSFPDCGYADVEELALYNTVLSGMSYRGDRFFYVNPLESDRKKIDGNPIYSHVRPSRPGWYRTACCPPNIARTIPAIGCLAYLVSSDALVVQMYLDSTVRLSCGASLRFITDYPCDGNLAIKVSGNVPKSFRLMVRIPAWCRFKALSISGEKIGNPTFDRGYLVVGNLHDGMAVEISNEMPCRMLHADPRVSADAGLVAVGRGPFIYCVEECDNGPDLSYLVLESVGKTICLEGVPAAFPCVAAEGSRVVFPEGTLYSDLPEMYEKTEIRMVPYCFWNNRGEGRMRVWLRCRSIVQRDFP